MSVFLIAGYIVVAVLVGVQLLALIGVWRKMTRRTVPRDEGKKYRTMAWFWIVMIFLYLGGSVWGGGGIDTNGLIMLVSWCVFVGIFLHRADPCRLRGEEEVRQNYVNDRKLCGRCDYDLTGNTSGTCPECGWEIPVDPIRLVDPNWHKWWRGWNIEYVNNWRDRLRMMVTVVVGLLVTIPVYVLLFPDGFWFVVVMMTAVILHMTITGLRLYQYGKREKSNEIVAAEETEVGYQQDTD